VLYLDGSRSKILIAPKLSASKDIEPTMYPLLKHVPVPQTFRTLVCDYNTPGES
jgi:hypothetical protein